MTGRSINTKSFLLQPIWSNTFSTFKGKTLCIDECIKSRILYVQDILKENGSLKKYKENIRLYEILIK